MNKILVFLVSFFAFMPLSGQVTIKDKWVEPGQNILAIGYNPDGTLLLTLGSDNRIFIRDAKTGAVNQSITTNHPKTNAVSFTSDGRFIVSGGSDGKITVWNYVLGEVFRELESHAAQVTCLAVSPEPFVIASGGGDHRVMLWNIERGELLFVLEGLSSEVTSIDFHPSENLIVAGSADGTIALWNTDNGSLINKYKADSENVYVVKFSPNGNFYAVGGGENRVSIWNSYNHILQNNMFGHGAAVPALIFSPDGRYLLSGDINNYIILTHVNTWEIAFHSSKQTDVVSAVAFNPSGTSFASAINNSDEITIWDATQFNIESAVISPHIDDDRPTRPKPEIEWITSDLTESIGLGFRLHYKVRTDDPIEYMNFYVNNRIYNIENNPELNKGIWNDLQEVIYLEHGNNEVFVELYYANGRVVSDVLNIVYRHDILASMLAHSIGPQRITVMLRASDRYEYVVRGAEGYSFQSDVIDVGDIEEDTIEVELIPLRAETSIRLKNIHFATNSADLTSESFAELDKVVDLLEVNPLYVIEISAHTCDLGTDAYNMLLSERRAQSVVNYLLDSEIEEDRLVARGYGLRNPMAPNTTEENRALNRRVEFTVIDIREDPDLLKELTGDEPE